MLIVHNRLDRSGAWLRKTLPRMCKHPNKSARITPRSLFRRRSVQTRSDLSVAAVASTFGNDFQGCSLCNGLSRDENSGLRR